MPACADAAIADAGSCANWTDMGAAIHAVAIHTSTRLNHMSDMPTCANTAITSTCAGADGADVCARPHAMATDMRTDTHAQHIHTCADIGESQCRC
jgi:hypothetical protein